MMYIKQTEEELITEGLLWCTKYKGYSDLEHPEDYGNKRVLLYNSAWVRLIRRIKDYTKENGQLIKMYLHIKIADCDQDIKDIFLKNLEAEGHKRELLFFLNDIEVEKIINSKDEQLDLNKQN